MQTPAFPQVDTGILAQKYDPVADRVLFVRLSESQIRDASFLDDRILAQGVDGFWSTPRQAEGYAGARGLHFIFHAGHCGSTLLSRMLAANPEVLPLREPLALRTLAELHDDLATPHALFDEKLFAARLDLLLRLWARGFASTRAVVVKATSTAGRIAPVLLEARPLAKGIYLTLKPEAYLATLLAGANAMIDLRGHAQERNRRLERLFGEAPLELRHASAGELAAMAWLAEKLALQAAAGPRLKIIDFDDMLADVEGTVTAAAAHLNLPAPEREKIAAILARYAKAPEHAYSPVLREQLLAQARRERAEELRKGLCWLERMAGRYEAAARALACA